MFDEKELPELVVWQRFLAYAAALGVAERVLEQLPVKYPVLNTNEGQMQYVYLYYMIHAHQMGALGGFAAVSHLSTELSSVHANAERVIAAARSRNSGGSGHGGGFSGGGGFGGGGGSFGAR